MSGRRTFLSLFVIDLACAGGAFFAYQRGIFQTIYANDASMMTSAIAALFVVTSVWLGWQAWNVDRLRSVGPFGGAESAASSDFGHAAERWAVMLGFVGTAIGLSLQAHALVSGPSSFGALATSLFTTASGGVAALLIGVMTHSLESGIKSARR